MFTRLKTERTFADDRLNFTFQLLNAAKCDFERAKSERGVKKVEKLQAEALKEQDAWSSDSSTLTRSISQRFEAVSRERAEEKMPDLLPQVDAQYEMCNFVEVPRIPFNPAEKIRKVLVLDLDKTLAKAGDFTSNIDFLFLDEWLKLFRGMGDDVAVIMVTSRVYPDVNLQDTERVVSALEAQVGRGKFVRSIIHTCGEPKADPVLPTPLIDLYRRFLAFEEDDAKANLGIVDDDLNYNIEPARALGFSVFHAQEGNSAHIAQVAEFIKPNVPPMAMDDDSAPLESAAHQSGEPELSQNFEMKY